ncbi:MAG: phosphoribosylamine--glycine ligase [Phycisphaerales bacterium]|nr:MAG: phosphoribosylamine--glycine ligase [Phycisphaerales bacterium]
MKVLVVGGGGREHALAIKAAQSPRVKALICAPGNAGTEALGENVPVSANDLDGLCALAHERRVDLTLVGPEAPLCAGIVDRFIAAGHRVFGPTALAARIEGDKAYAKELMRAALIPTAEARIFHRFADARQYALTRDCPLVVKASGLAAGKGVILCDKPADAVLALERVMVEKVFGEAGNAVLVEEMLEGPELSVLALVDGETIYVLESSQDHKRVGEGDTGPNTGGMGAYSPAPIATDAVLAQVERQILVPIIDVLLRDGNPYSGVLYAGLMLTPGGPKVLEFNCRFGDPEIQAVLPRLQTDLIDVIEAVLDRRLSEVDLRWDPRPAVCVVMASAGYPGSYKKGHVIEGLSDAEALPDVTVFHAGTKRVGDKVVTDGGRVLGVTALGDDVASARARALEAVDTIHFDGAFCRRDIAHRAL